MFLDHHLAQASLVTMDELMRAYARLPLTEIECQEIVSCFAVRMRAGRRLSAMPLNAGLDDASPEAQRFLIQRISAQGVALVTSFDLRATLLILKTDAGKGLFGRQKVAYACFVSESSDGYERAGTVPTIPRAFGILDTMYEVVEAADRLTR